METIALKPVTSELQRLDWSMSRCKEEEKFSTWRGQRCEPVSILFMRPEAVARKMHNMLIRSPRQRHATNTVCHDPSPSMRGHRWNTLRMLHCIRLNPNLPEKQSLQQHLIWITVASPRRSSNYISIGTFKWHVPMGIQFDEQW